MKNFFSLLLLSFLLLAFFQNCQKGEAVPYQQFMHFRLEAFYPDSALYYQVRVNDSVLSEFAGHSGGSIVNLVQGQKNQLPRLDSARLKITIIKKNGRNYILDSTVYLTNDNDFLLLQVDDKLRPTLINKRIATVTERKPGKDSLRVRFFYNDYDDIRRNGNILKNIELQIFSYRIDSLGNVNEPPLKDEGRIRNVRSGELTPYISLRYQNEGSKRGFVFEIYPPNSTPTTKPQYPRKYDEIDGFIGGSLSVDNSRGTFHTFRITKFDPASPYRNGLFLFGFK